MTVWKLWFDGGCEDNGGPAASASYGYVLLNADTGKRYTGAGTVLSARPTNNLAEWAALLAGVRRLVKKAGEKDTVEVVGDSVLVVNGITGKWKGKDPRLARVKELVKSELSKVRSWTAAWVPRDQNQEADRIGRKKSGKTLDLRFLDDPAPVARRGFF